ncbi:hypothetical protein BerOc1_00603 [Pseudodesulfovibrio hydrargyri]|uniref:Uncharacterized protein n=1 Tax=Pseudodesulfovibrio hydrargyri TaxID=2125990 RepID=A0A1J5N1I7_9BACT|nr:hypothetical protein BerOc1_00603 [Pseudodesulfovibrio hydrargyri]
MNPLTPRPEEKDLKPLELMAPSQARAAALCPPVSPEDDAPC